MTPVPLLSAHWHRLKLQQFVGQLIKCYSRLSLARHHTCSIRCRYPPFRPPHYDSTSPSDKMEAKRREKANFPIKHSFRLIWLRKVGAICSLRESVIDCWYRDSSFHLLFYFSFLCWLSRKENKKNCSIWEKQRRGKCEDMMKVVVVGSSRTIANCETYSSNSQTFRTAVARTQRSLSQLDPSFALISTES